VVDLLLWMNLYDLEVYQTM